MIRRFLRLFPGFGGESDSEPARPEYNCRFCEEMFHSLVSIRVHEMDEHPREMNPPTVREDELETLLDETEADLRALYGVGKRASGVYVLERIRREMIEE